MPRDSDGLRGHSTRSRDGGLRRELDLVAARGDAPGQLGGTRGGGAGEPLVDESAEDRVELVARGSRGGSRAMTKAADSRSMSWPTSAAANTCTIVRRRQACVRPRCALPGSSMWSSPARPRTPVRNSTDERCPSPTARRLRMNRQLPGETPDWSGCATAEGLNRAAASTANSWVNQAPTRLRRSSDSRRPRVSGARSARSAPSAHPADHGGAPRSGHRPVSRSIRLRLRAARGSSTAPPRPGIDRRATARDRARTAAPARAPDPRSGHVGPGDALRHPMSFIAPARDSAANCSVESSAKVDSAPWFSLRPKRSKTVEAAT